MVRHARAAGRAPVGRFRRMSEVATLKLDDVSNLNGFACRTWPAPIVILRIGKVPKSGERRLESACNQLGALAVADHSALLGEGVFHNSLGANRGMRQTG